MDSTLSAATGTASVVVGLLVAVFFIAVMWRIFTKAGRPGWASIVPIYNVIVMLQIVNRPTWWIVLMLIPGVNVVIGIMVISDLAKSYGKGAGFAVGMIFLSFIFYPILAFGGAEYARIERATA
jgi:ABC-type sulfate transport system permease subunit